MALYDLFVTNVESRGQQLYASCPLHPDSNASFTINSETNEWFCHGCSRGGAEPEFIEAYYGVSNKIARWAVEQWDSKGKLPFPTNEYIEQCHKQLLGKPQEISILNSFGITDAIISEFRLGWDDCRITIPVPSQTGEIVNVRKYLPPHRRIEGSNNVKVINVRGLGENRFYPFKAFQQPIDVPIIIVEGEKDCLAARGDGLNAVTGTSGSSVPILEVGLFKDRNVYIMTDTDPTGRKLAKAYETALRPFAASIGHIKLPSKDYVDFRQQFPEHDIMAYVVADLEQVQPAETTKLSRSEGVEKLNSWVILENMSVVGTDPKTYTIPTKLKPVCKNPTCTKPCPASSGVVSIEIDVDARQMLRFIDGADSVQDDYLRKMFGCKDIIAEPAEYTNAQKLLFQESASFVEGIDDASFEHRFGVFLYEEQRLLPTQKYTFTCSRVSDPRTQQNFYVIKDAKPVVTVAPAHDPENDYIAYFQATDASSGNIMELLDNHYKTWMKTLNIEGRVDLFGALVLTYLSVTEINWRGGKLKGWLDSIVVGDTRTGKSQMAQRFVKKIGLGGYINGENARATGVIGGVQKMGDSWVITWGAIPMNDRGLLIVDEASGLSIDDIKEMSATRSSGAVSINKIAKGEARARTRLIWMSNPRSGKNLEDFYWRGYGAFLEFIPVVEDQARYDVVLTAAREDVATLEGIPEGLGEPDLDKWRNLIDFAWSVEADDIIISEAAEREIAKTAKELDKDYGGGPLVVGVAVHEKLIRLACAVAILCGAIRSNKVAVDVKHIQYASDFLRYSYDKPTLDYRGYIAEYKRAQRAKAENTKHVRGLCELYPALKVLLASNIFRGGQVKEVLGVDQTEASKLISDLLRRGLLKVTGSGAYAPDKLLIEIAKQMEV